jgi:glutathione S-transferase
MPLVLHYHPLSSYCHKVLVALYEFGLPFEGRLLNLGDAAERDAYLALWPTGKMPLLVDGERVVPESSVIVEYLQANHPVATTLLPPDEPARLDVRLWDRLFDLYVMTPMQAIVADRLRPEASRDPHGVAASRATLAMAYGLVDRHLAGHAWPTAPPRLRSSSHPPWCPSRRSTCTSRPTSSGCCSAPRSHACSKKRGPTCASIPTARPFLRASSARPEKA